MTRRPHSPRVLGVIPARGGSKGIARKNLRPIAGKPLLAWSIEAAQKSRGLSRWVVSTEDAEITAVARSLGAEVLPRPADLATDEATTLAVLQHAARALPADIVVVLQPTSPVRGTGLVDSCIETFLESGADSLATVRRDFGYEYGVEVARRQELTPRLVDTGNVYVIDATLIEAGHRFGDRRALLETSREESVDVDEEFDLWLAELILLHRPPADWTTARRRVAAHGVMKSQTE